LDNQDTTIRELTRHNEDLAARLRLLEAELEALRAENAALKKDKSALDQVADVAALLKKLEEELGKGFNLKARSDGVAIEVAETVLFDVGRATLRPEGRRVLTELAEKLKEFPGEIRVEGHTDNAPVVVHLKEFPKGNLELSGERALAVAHFLITEGGLPPQKVCFAGFGEHHPVADNDSNESKQRNRRVEIVLLKPEVRPGR
jgi:chemotaxis protein MotB